MFKLSHLDKCWLVAKIEKIAAPIIFFFGLLPFITNEGEDLLLDETFSSLGIVGIISIIVAGLYAHTIAIKVSKFASDNFQEIISRRTKWKSSNVELHEMKYKYALTTYGYVLFSILTPIFSIVCLISRIFYT